MSVSKSSIRVAGGAVVLGAILASSVQAATLTKTVNWDGGGADTNWSNQANWVEESLVIAGSGPKNDSVFGSDKYNYNVIIDSAMPVYVDQKNFTVSSLTIGSAANAASVTTTGGSNKLTTTTLSVLGHSVLDISYTNGLYVVGSGNALTYESTAKIQGAGRIVFTNSQNIAGGTYNVSVGFGTESATTSSAYAMQGNVTVGSYNGQAKSVTIISNYSGAFVTQTLNTGNYSLSIAGGLTMGEYDKKTDAGNQSSYAVINAGTSSVSIGGDVTIVSDANGVNQSGAALKKDSYINAGAATFKFGGSFAVNRATNKWVGDTISTGWDTHLATFEFNGGGSAAAPKILEVMSEDRGGDGLADTDWDNNFAIGTLIVKDGTYLKLQDLYDNAYTGDVGSRVAVTGAEALYVDNISIAAGSTLDLNGINVYYSGTASIEGTIIGGSLTSLHPVPEPAAIGLLGAGALFMLARKKSRA